MTDLKQGAATRLVPVLLYHSVSDSPPAWIRPFSVTPTIFAEHLRALKREGVTPLRMADLDLSLVLLPPEKRPELPKRPVLVTFDDGLRDFYDHALPLLEAASFPVALFLCTGFVDGLAARAVPSRPSGAWLNVDDLHDMSGRGVEIGSHSHSHLQLDLLNEQWSRVEVELSKRLLQDKAGLCVDAFSYPYGYSNLRVRQQVRSAGYRIAFRVGDDVHRPGGDVFALPRLMVRASTPIEDIVNWVAAPERVHSRAPDGAGVRAWRVARRLRHPVRGGMKP